MNRRGIPFTSLALMALLLAACGPASTPQGAESYPPMPAPPLALRQPGLVDKQAEEAERMGRVAASGERMVISTAELVVIVDDVEVSLPQVEGIVSRMQGYIVSSSSYRTASDRLAATITLRVPSEKFQESLTELRALAKKVQSESLFGEDVTDRYVDLEARLTALQATEKELLALLTEVRQSEGNAQQKAQAILDIYNRLTEVRSQIEQIQGQMKYLEQMSAMATITVQLLPYEPTVEPPIVEEGFDPLRTINRAARALVIVLQGLVNLLIWVIIVFVPLAAIVALPVLVTIWLVRRRRKHAKSSPMANRES